jgi:uncharacterized protein (TIGR02687 family)
VKRVDESLERVLSRHRLIFWYDPKHEWTQAYEEFGGEHVRKLKVEGNEFAAKVRIHRDPDTSARYLIYLPTARPADSENWLLDLLLQGHEFKADRASLVLQDVGLPYELRPVVEEHIAFFTTRHVQALSGMVGASEDPGSLRLKMMAVLAGCEADVDALLLSFLGRGSDDALIDPVQERLGPASLTTYFWKAAGLRFGYASNEPTLRDFVTTLFRWADPLEKGPKLDEHARVFLRRWMDSQRFSNSFRRWSKVLEDDLHISGRLNDLDSPATIGEWDVFEVVDKYVLHWLCKGFAQGIPDAELRATIERRRGSFWFHEHKDGYEALARAIELRELVGAAELQVESVDAGITRYLATWHRIDTAYRRFYLHQRRYGQVALTGPVAAWVEKTYVNNFLLTLADRWCDRVRAMSGWACDVLPPQTDFYRRFVRPFLDRGQKVYVIVSDVLRYEAAAELVASIQAENRWTAELDAVLGSIPSYTQLGMAALLPGARLGIETDGNVLVDGKSATGTEARSQILGAALEGRARAVQAEVFLEMNTKTEARTLLRDNDVVYVFHNAIDKVGDSPATEAKTTKAVESAFDELMQIVRKIANANGSNMLLTADHGFLFQQSEVSESDDLPLPGAGEWLLKNRRFALGRGIEADASVRTFSACELGLDGDWEAAFPLALGRFPLRGSGKRYVHGGLSLQEVIVPVVRIHKARSDDTEAVEVDILRAPSKITTGQLSLALYQAQPIADKTLARTLSVGVYAPDGEAISEVRSLTFESAAEEPRLRERTVGLTLSRAADEYNGQEVEIRLVETIPGTAQTAIYKSHRVRLRKPFESDFDD